MESEELNDFSTMKGLPTERLPSPPILTQAKKKPSQLELTQLIAAAYTKYNDGDNEVLFELGQLYFEQGNYEEALSYFKKSQDYESKYQLAIMTYDGLGCEADATKGVELLSSLAKASQVPRVVLRAAQYNIGRAYYNGYGVRQSTPQAVKWWNLAADGGSPKGSVIAQTTLGYYYCQPDSRDLRRAYNWHIEASRNGSVESQGCLGIMYLHGLGVKQNSDTAFYTLKRAAERGNVYAMGNLVSIYYRKKLFTKCTELAVKVLAVDDVDRVAEESQCLRDFVAKGLAIANFIYGRCLHKGLAVRRDRDEAYRCYSRSYHHDPDICAQMQNLANRGLI